MVVLQVPVNNVSYGHACRYLWLTFPLERARSFFTTTVDGPGSLSDSSSRVVWAARYLFPAAKRDFSRSQASSVFNGKICTGTY